MGKIRNHFSKNKKRYATGVAIGIPTAAAIALFADELGHRVPILSDLLHHQAAESGHNETFANNTTTYNLTSHDGVIKFANDLQAKDNKTAEYVLGDLSDFINFTNKDTGVYFQFVHPQNGTGNDSLVLHKNVMFDGPNGTKVPQDHQVRVIQLSAYQSSIVQSVLPDYHALGDSASEDRRKKIELARQYNTKI